MPSKTKRQVQKVIRRIKSAFTHPVRVGNLHNYYRFSDAGYDKLKPPYVKNDTCLRNFLRHFGKDQTLVFADNVSDTTWNQLLNSCPKTNCERTALGSSPGFNNVLDLALKLPPEDAVYFVEGDYLHHPGAAQILIEGLELGADYVTLYDHPDKYFDGGNPLIEGDGEITKVYLTKSCHWKLTNSTTLTFAATVKTLKRDECILRKWTKPAHANDFELFMELGEQGKSLISPIPGYSTHGETKWLCPLVNWEALAKEE